MKIHITLLKLFVLIPTLLSAAHTNKDTIRVTNIEYQKINTETKDKKNLHITLFTGVYSNKTFGLHPIFGAKGGVRLNSKSSLYLATEFRFGKSKNYYEFVINDSLINTNHFLGEYAGIEFDRLIYSKNRHELVSMASIGYDLIRTPIINDEIHRRYGFAFNLGLGYLFKIKNGGGPQIKFIYHYANIKNEKGTNPNNNSLIIRLTYILGYKE